MSAYALSKDVSLKRKNNNVFIPCAILLLLLGIAGVGGEAWAAAPPAPTNLTATMASSRQINLAWTDNATTETNYYVERSPNGSSTWKVVATLGANITSYQNTGLTQNTIYYYRVRCKAGKTYSSYSNTANATAATLAAPTALTATVASATQITLAWTDNTSYETQYSIERSPNGTSSWTVLGTVATNVTTTTNSGLTAGTAYYYRVRAYDSTNYSGYSNTANQTIRTIVATAGANGAITPTGTVGVANGSNQTFTMTPNSGYKIASVTVDGSAVATNSTYTFADVTANHTISATFSVSTYTITASAGANGSISPSGAVVVAGGSNQVFTITPNSGYKITTVTVDGSAVATNPTYTFTSVTAPHTISATFSVQTYTITAIAGPNGTINPSGIYSVNSGSTPTFTATPNSGYHILDILVDGVSVGSAPAYIFPPVTANHSISASFASDNLVLSGIMISNHTINTSTLETTNIFFTINSAATATLKIIPELQGPTGTPVYQAAQACSTSGAFFFTWDGKDNTGRVVPDEAYLYIIEASDGVRSTSYSPLTPTGPGSVACSYNSDFNPVKNIPMTVNYIPILPSRININISWGGQYFAALSSFPVTQANQSFVWHGRNPQGKLLDKGARASCSISSLIRENHIITAGDRVKVAGLVNDPYSMHLAYGQFSRIRYSLSRDANVTVSLVSPSGTTITLVNNQSQVAGPQQVDWYGTDPADSTGTRVLISEEGNYMVSVFAVNPMTGTSSTTISNLTIGY